MRLGEAAARDADFLAAAAAAEWDHLAATGEGVTFPRTGFVALHPAMQVRLLQLASAALGAEAPSARQLLAALDGLTKRRSQTSLAGAVTVTVSPTEICVEKDMGRP